MMIKEKTFLTELYEETTSGKCMFKIQYNNHYYAFMCYTSYGLKYLYMCVCDDINPYLNTNPVYDCGFKFFGIAKDNKVYVFNKYLLCSDNFNEFPKNFIDVSNVKDVNDYITKYLWY